MQCRGLLEFTGAGEWSLLSVLTSRLSTDEGLEAVLVMPISMQIGLWVWCGGSGCAVAEWSVPGGFSYMKEY
jgi:hypothetical protein